MRAELKRLHAETKSTIIYVTHDQLEALTMSTKIAVMNLGRLQQYEDPMSVYHHPSNTFTADFIGNPKINLVPAVMKPDSSGVVVEIGAMNIHIDGAQYPKGSDPSMNIKAGIRAEDFIVSATEEPGTEKGSVYSVLPAGSQWYLKIKLSDGTMMTVTVYKDLGLDTDDPIWVSAIPERVKCFDESGMLLFKE